MSGASSSSSTTGKKSLQITTRGGQDINLDALPKLKGECNYYVWARTWKRVFRMMHLWEVVNGDIKQPFDKGSKRINAQAHNLLIHTVHEDILSTVVFADNANAAWKALKDLYECKLPVTTLLSTVLDTKMQDGGSISDHLQTFHSNLVRHAQKCCSVDDDLAKILKPITDSDEVKAVFLLSSLPKSMSSIVKTIQTKQDVTYEDAREQLLSSNALYNRAQPSGDKECSWCKKRKLAYKGHHYTNCRKLKEKKRAKLDKQSGAL